jgi:hypothetical protein
VTRLKDSPPSVKVYFNRAVTAVDPVSGDLVVVQAVLGNDITDFTGRIELWKYESQADAWTQLDETIVPSPTGWWEKTHPAGVVVVPISQYGVILFLSFAGGKSATLVYKHR